MSYERSKAPLALMEQIIMILVFAVAAAVCLQAFVYSNQLSKQGANQEIAANTVQRIAEYAKADKGDLEKISQDVGGSVSNDEIIVNDTENNMQFVLRLTDQTEYLVHAKVAATDSNKQEIYSIDVAWQKGA